MIPDLTAQPEYRLEWTRTHALTTGNAALLAAVEAEIGRRRDMRQADEDRRLRQHVNPRHNLHLLALDEVRRMVALGLVSHAEAAGEISRRHGALEPLAQWKGSHLEAQADARGQKLK